MGIWYKEWYLTTPQGEADIRAALTDPDNGGANRTDIQNRLAEIRALEEDRCAISRDQKRFLTRILES